MPRFPAQCTDAPSALPKETLKSGERESTVLRPGHGALQTYACASGLGSAFPPSDRGTVDSCKEGKRRLGEVPRRERVAASTRGSRMSPDTGSLLLCMESGSPIADDPF
jgi:hypothetical protein